MPIIKTIIINNLGLSATYTEQILKLMPKNITLSFSHISPKLKKNVSMSTQGGKALVVGPLVEELFFTLPLVALFF